MKIKWDRKIHPPSSYHTSMINHVFPVSWFSKFKKKGGNPETNSSKKQQKCKLDLPTQNSTLPSVWKEAKFYNVCDDDGYWRLSFHEVRTEGRKSTGGINPLWHDSEDEFQITVPSFKSFDLRETEMPRREENGSINGIIVHGRKKVREQHKEKKIRIENGGLRRTKSNGEEVTRMREYVDDLRSRKPSNRVVRKLETEFERGPCDGVENQSRQIEKYTLPIEPENIHHQMEGEFPNSRIRRNLSFQNSNLSSIKKDYAFAAVNGEKVTATSETVAVSGWQNLENNKFKETKVKSESKEKSACMNRESHSRKVKRNLRNANSLKTECRIRVLKDMKKPRMKLKKKTKQQAVEGKTTFDSFAMVKSSFNPQQDFKDSMVEMISEQGIRRREELEELLACYLTLNCDGYHDLIIKIFQQNYVSGMKNLGRSSLK